jgi:hypothetical protein
MPPGVQISDAVSKGIAINAVVIEHPRVERVKLRIVNVRLDHAFLEIVEPNGPSGTAEI